MDYSAWMDSVYFEYGILPLLIFLSRICDVSIGTLRIIFLARDKTFLAPILGFFEVMIWLAAVGQVVQNLTSPLLYLAYAGGYASGTYIGIMIEKRLAIGMVILRVIVNDDATPMVMRFIEEQLRVTHFKAESGNGRVHILFMVVRRKALKRIVSMIEQDFPDAFFSIEDVRQVHEGIPAQAFVPNATSPVLRK